MNVSTAVRLFSARPFANRAEVFPLRRPDRHARCAPGSPPDLWPYAATAAVWLAGNLDDAQNDADLDEGLDHFQSLLYGGVVTTEQWAETMLEVASLASRRENDATDCARTAV